MKHMRILGIDYGKRKMGLAISEGQLASPFKVLEIASLSDAIGKTRQVINQERIDQVVIGLPESGEALRITKKFIFQLKPFIPVIEAEETLSSHQASSIMLDLKLKKKARGREDAYAASLILQNYLDSAQID